MCIRDRKRSCSRSHSPWFENPWFYKKQRFVFQQIVDRAVCGSADSNRVACSTIEAWLPGATCARTIARVFSAGDSNNVADHCCCWWLGCKVTWTRASTIGDQSKAQAIYTQADTTTQKLIVIIRWAIKVRLILTEVANKKRYLNSLTMTRESTLDVKS